LLLRSCQPRPLIFHPQADELRAQFDTQAHLATVSVVLERVGQQIEQNLTQTATVRLHIQITGHRLQQQSHAPRLHLWLNITDCP